MRANEWQVLNLSNIAKIIDCKHRTPDYVEHGIPLISPGTIKWGPLDLVSPIKRVTYEEYMSLMDHCKVEVGDLVLSRNQSVGIASIVESNEPFVLGQDTVLIKATKADARFIYFKLQSTSIQRSIIKLTGGSTFSRINLGDIKKINIELPPLAEQKKIAQILSTWDKAIATTEKLLENSQKQKQALMQQLLTGKKRFAGFSDVWPIQHLENVCQITMGSSPSSDAYNESQNGLPLLQGNADIFNRVSRARIYTTEITKKCNVGDALLSVRAPVGTVAKSMHEACIGRGIASIKAKKDHEQEFVYQWLLWFEPKWAKYSQGSTFESINSDDIKTLKIKLPSLDEQRKIASVLELADKENQAIQSKLDFLREEKMALMQQLLTGKRRVKVEH